MSPDTETGGPGETTADELEKLRRENAELKAKVPVRTTSKARSFFSWVLIVLMCIATFGAALTVWVHYTTLNTSRFVNIVAGLVQEPDVDKALSQEAISRLFARYDLKKRIEDQLKSKLPELLKSAAEPVSSGAEGLATPMMSRLPALQPWVGAAGLLSGVALVGAFAARSISGRRS